MNKLYIWTIPLTNLLKCLYGQCGPICLLTLTPNVSHMYLLKTSGQKNNKKLSLVSIYLLLPCILFILFLLPATSIMTNEHTTTSPTIMVKNKHTTTATRTPLQSPPLNPRPPPLNHNHDHCHSTRSNLIPMAPPHYNLLMLP